MSTSLTCVATPRADSYSDGSSGGLLMSTATSTHGPNAFATSIGRLSTTSPSTSRRPSHSTGGNTSGMDMLARTARARSPFAITTGSPFARSVAIARKGIGSRSKSPPTEKPAGERCSMRKRFTRCSARKPPGSLSVFQSKLTPAVDAYRSSRRPTGSVRRSGRPLKSEAQSIERTIASSSAAFFPVA